MLHLIQGIILHKKIALALALILLVGCSNQMAYNHLDWLVSWYVDDYVELNSQQEDKLQTGLNSLLVWHRQDELPVYHEQLSALLADVNIGQMPTSLWMAHIVKVRGHLSRVRIKANRHLTGLASDLSTSQVNELFENLQNENKEAEEEFNDLSSDEVLEQRIEKLNDSFEEYLGSLSPQQDSIIHDYINKTSSNSLAYIHYNRRLQGLAQDMFTQFSGQTLNDKLYALFIGSKQYKSAALQQNSALKIELGAQLLHDIYASLSSKQLANFKDEIIDLQATLSELMAEEV